MRSITPRTAPSTASLIDVTSGTFTGHGTEGDLRAGCELVKNADENWPTTSRSFSEVTDVRPAWNRDDFLISPARSTLVPPVENS